ncbi:methyl-accepting chemotaxis protein [Brevibacillus fulvus]|uniref:Methyl-accepting chemotaxis protein n=1 Tax=Brevibacillus fulvus TaxID=1125967 RepID=A0A938Y4T5_9BACL|nr:methyl-accepting chemotaxis protein [Brevibacillus fulvus]MBM7591597.1 methyl-accepting chemotaxis protein [Brevibacillus fulvus]
MRGKIKLLTSRTQKHRSIMHKLFAGICFIVLIIMSSSAVSIGHQAQLVLSQNAKEQLVTAAESSVKEVRLRVQSIISSLETFAAVYKTNSVSNSDVFDAFEEMASKNKDISELQIASTSGKFFSFPGSPTDDSYDPRQTDWYKGAIAQKGVFISDVFRYSETEFPKVAISLPINDASGQVAQVLVAFVSIPSLSEFVEQMRIGATGYVCIVDQSGRVVAHPDKKFALQRPAYENRNLIKELLANKTGFSHTTLQGNAILAAYVYDPVLRWGVIVSQNEAEVQTEVDRLQHIILLVFIIGLIVLAAVLYFFVRAITRPLKEVQQKLERFSEGDLSQAISVKTNDEMKILADSFNRMSGKLREIIRDISQVSLDVKAIAAKVAEESQHSWQSQIQISAVIATWVSEMEKQKEEIEQIGRTTEQITDEIAIIHSHIAEAGGDHEQVLRQSSQVNMAFTELTNSMAEISQDMKASQMAIGDLHLSIIEAGGILSSILEISKKTKLLSLNARIEASRAGHLGLGFGVVADEIRNLSEQTEAAAQQIERVLMLIQNNMNIVADRMTQTEKATVAGGEILSLTTSQFRQIVQTSEGLYHRFQQIQQLSSAIHKQSHLIENGVGLLAASHQTIIAGSQEAAASAEESAAIAQQFTEDADQLTQLVDGLQSEIAYFRP